MKVLVLDFDNCIALDEKTGKGSEEVKVGAWFHVFSEYPKEDVEKALQEGNKKVVGGQGDRRDVVAEVLRQFGVQVTEDEVTRRCDSFNRLVQEGVRQIGISEQTRVALTKLSKAIPLYVNTATPIEAVLESLNSLGLTPLFKGVYGRPGTKLGNLQAIIQAEAVTPEEILFVDDQQSAWLISQEVGCRFVGIHTERNKLWREKPQPFPIIRSLSELPSFV